MATYAERCFQRAQEAGHYAWIQEDGSMKIASDSEPGVARRVTFDEHSGLIRFSCDCPAGQHRRDFIPCKHAARAALRLQREGMAVLRYGQVYVAEHLMPKLDISEEDVFAPFRTRGDR